MRILLITLEYPPQKGGVASYYAGLVTELRRQGHEMAVITNSRNPSHPPLNLRGGELLGWIWPRWIKGYFTVRRALKTARYDLLLVGHLLPLGTIAYLLRRRVPYVVFTHGMDVLIAQKSWRKRWLARKILAQAKLVVANSRFTKQAVDIVCGVKLTIVRNTPHTIVVYPCPAISPTVQPENVESLRQRLGLAGKKILLTLGRVVERKGHDLILHALPEILQHVPNVIYLVAGDGPDLGRLQAIVSSPRKRGSRNGAKGLDSRLRGNDNIGVVVVDDLRAHVRFVGAVPDEERPLYYALCDLFVMPSRQIGPDVEGFGLSFLEAALFGKPSIGGQSGGVSEAILDDKTGVLVDPNDASSLARAVVQILRDDRLRGELGHAAWTRVLEEFTWEKQIRNLAFML